MTTTLNPRELPTSDPRACPSWCVDEPNHSNWDTLVDSGLPIRCHSLPTFGRFAVGAEQTFDGMNPPTVMLGDLDGMELDAEQVAEFARDARLAAEWLARHSEQPYARHDARWEPVTRRASPCAKPVRVGLGCARASRSSRFR